MRKEITETVTKTINICDHKDCEVDVNFLYVQRICEGCSNVFCEDHLFRYGDEGDDSNYEVLCQYCIDVYDELLSPFKLEIYNLRKKKNAISKKIFKVQDKIEEICKKNHLEQMKTNKDLDSEEIIIDTGEDILAIWPSCIEENDLYRGKRRDK